MRAYTSEQWEVEQDMICDFEPLVWLQDACLGCEGEALEEINRLYEVLTA